MRYRYVHYNLENGFIHNWLVAGPQAIPVDIDQFKGENLQQKIAHPYYEAKSGIMKTPVERGPLTKGLFQLGDYTGSWSYYACREDHLVDHSKVYSTPHFLRSWAYTQIASKTAQEVALELTTHGPADVWLNGQHVVRQENFFEQFPGSVPIKVSLVEGMNKILVRFEYVTIRNSPYAMALQVCKLSEEQTTDHLIPYPDKTGVHVCIPTLIKAISRRNKIEQVSAATYITQDVFEGDDQIKLHWPDDLDQTSPAVVRLMTTSKKIYAEGTVDGTPGDRLFLSFPFQIPEGSCRIFMMPLAWEYYDRDIRITHEINLWSLGKNRYSATPYGTYAERNQEALTNAMQRTGLFAENAKMALSKWQVIEPKIILQAARWPNPLNLLGILGMLYRFGNHVEFPKTLVQPLEECILGFQYEPEGASVDIDSGESQQILYYACEILAGQRYPELTFKHSGKLGQWHRENGERLALEWLQSCAATGFSEWDSNCSFADYLTALSHLVDLAESESVWELAAVVMDKLFFTIAINSYKGVFGSTHGRTYAHFVKGGLLEPTSGIARLMWGTGIFNHHIAGPVSLACMEKYEIPSIIADIAVSLPEEMWNRERHAVSAGRVVNKVTYKTPDSMLCSAQDYCAGEKGSQEHIWQATLGAAATVFVTHPPCTSEDESRQPNFWAGNAVLPRVAQWKDMLIAVYQLPENDWMGFTHAYFPTYAFDEYILRGGWAFARKGDGYLALTAAQGINLIRRGQYAFRELRSYGQINTWLCHVGRAKLEGDFNSFQEKVLALSVVFDNQTVRCSTLRGEALSFGWRGPFLRDGQEQSLSGFEHYENPYTLSAYPCTQLEIQLGEDMLRINLGSPDVS